MSFTYDPSLPTDRDTVRFRLMDTDASGAKLQDEEINAVLGQVGGTGLATALRAAARIARSLNVRYGLISSVSAIGTSIAFKDRSYLDLANELEQEAAGASSSSIGMPFVGGISRSQKATTAADPDRVEPWAELELHDNPLAG